MAAHWLSLRTTVSAVENLDVICDSIAWLSGDADSINVDKTKFMLFSDRDVNLHSLGKSIKMRPSRIEIPNYCKFKLSKCPLPATCQAIAVKRNIKWNVII